MNFIFISSNTSSSSVNLFFRNNLENIDAIIIDYTLLINELIRLISTYPNSHFSNLNDIFNNVFDKKNIGLSSPEIINEIINYIYIESEESFLYKSFFYSIPVFISDGDALSYINNNYLYNKELDLCILKKINEKNKVEKILLLERNNKLTLLELLSSMGALSNEGYSNLYYDEYLDNTDGSGYLYEEIMDYDRQREKKSIAECNDYYQEEVW